jgi:hypothetical protein
MPKFRCPYGHVEAKGGQLVPMVHDSRARCSIYVKLRAERKVDIFGRPTPGTDISGYLVKPNAPTNSPGAPAPSETKSEGEVGAGPGQKIAPLPAREEKPSLSRRLAGGLGLRYRDVTVTPPGAAGAPAGETDWIVSEDTSERFWEVIFGFIETVVNLITQFFEIPPVPKEVFELDPGQRFVFRTAFRPTTTQILKKVFGARSPEEADRIVAGLSGLLGFGMIAIKIVLHFMIHLPKSPKLAGWRARRDEARARRERERLDLAKRDGKFTAEQLAIAERNLQAIEQRAAASALARQRATAGPAGAAG